MPQLEAGAQHTMTTINHLQGYAFAKKTGDTIHIFEGPHALADFMPVIAEGSDVPRMLKDRFADVVNVRDFGARGGLEGEEPQQICFRGSLARHIGGWPLPFNMMPAESRNIL